MCIDVLERWARISRYNGRILADPGPVSDPDHRQECHRSDQQSPVGQRQDEQDAHELNDGSPRVVDHSEDQFGNSTGIFTQETGYATSP